MRDLGKAIEQWKLGPDFLLEMDGDQMIEALLERIEELERRLKDTEFLYRAFFVLANKAGIQPGSAFTFNDGTITDCVFRRCGLISTGGATFTGATFDEPSGTVGVTASSPANAAKISGCTFNSDGTGNGLEEILEWCKFHSEAAGRTEASLGEKDR